MYTKRRVTRFGLSCMKSSPRPFARARPRPRSKNRIQPKGRSIDVSPTLQSIFSFQNFTNPRIAKHVSVPGGLDNLPHLFPPRGVLSRQKNNQLLRRKPSKQWALVIPSRIFKASSKRVTSVRHTHCGYRSVLLVSWDCDKETFSNNDPLIH